MVHGLSDISNQNSTMSEYPYIRVLILSAIVCDTGGIGADDPPYVHRLAKANLHLALRLFHRLLVLLDPAGLVCQKMIGCFYKAINLVNTKRGGNGQGNIQNECMKEVSMVYILQSFGMIGTYSPLSSVPSNGTRK